MKTNEERKAEILSFISDKGYVSAYYIFGWTEANLKMICKTSKKNVSKQMVMEALQDLEVLQEILKENQEEQ
jgi:hypothetical protein